MNGEVFYWVLNMSIAGTLVGSLILLLQKLVRLPRRLTFVLWAIPFLRFLVPFGVKSEYSLMNLIEKQTVRPVFQQELNREKMEFAIMNMIQQAETYFPITYRTKRVESFFVTAEWIWLIVTVGALLAVASIYLMTKAELKTAVHLRDNLYQSDRISSPMVFGIVRPKILLPVGFDAAGSVCEPDWRKSTVGQKNHYVLLHEQVHICRLDNLWRVLAVLTCCIHWFNPLIWLFLKSFCSDQELACDETVISFCGESRRKEYAGALLDWEEQRTVFASAFGGAKIKLRIEKILSYRRLTVFSLIGFVVLMAVVAVSLLTNAAG